MREFLSIADAAAEVGLSEKTIRRALSDPIRHLRHFRPGRRVIIAAEDLRQWLASYEAPLTIPSTLLETLSPDAQSILSGILGTPAAPAAGKCKNSKGRPTGSDSVNRRSTGSEKHGGLGSNGIRA